MARHFILWTAVPVDISWIDTEHYFSVMFQLKGNVSSELEPVAERIKKMEVGLQQLLDKLVAFQKVQSERIFSMGGYTMTMVGLLLYNIVALRHASVKQV